MACETRTLLPRGEIVVAPAQISADRQAIDLGDAMG
jgi:hypothetical protein